MDKEHFGEKLKMTRLDRGLTQADLATELLKQFSIEVSAQRLGQIEASGKPGRNLAKPLRTWIGNSRSGGQATGSNGEIAADWGKALVELAERVSASDITERLADQKSRTSKASNDVARSLDEAVTGIGIVQVLRRAIVLPEPVGRPISLLCLGQSPFDSVQSRQAIVDCALLAARRGRRIIYAAIGGSDFLAGKFETSHFALNLEAAIATAMAETHLRGKASSSSNEHLQPLAFASRSFGGTESAFSNDQAGSQTAVGVNILSVPQEGIFISLPISEIEKPGTTIIVPATSSDDALQEFSKFLELAPPQINVYTKVKEEEFCKRYAEIEDRDSERRLAQRSLSSLTRPVDYFRKGGPWFQSLLKRVNDCEKASRISEYWHKRTTETRRLVRSGTRYRHICDFVALQQWVRTGKARDFEVGTVDDVETRLKWLKDTVELLGQPKSGLELAIVDNFDELMGRKQQESPKTTNWIVIGEHAMLEVLSPSHDIGEIHVVMRNKTVATALAAWFEATWPHNYNRNDHIAKLQQWINELSG